MGVMFSKVHKNFTAVPFKAFLDAKNEEKINWRKNKKLDTFENILGNKTIVPLEQMLDFPYFPKRLPGMLNWRKGLKVGKPSHALCATMSLCFNDTLAIFKT